MRTSETSKLSEIRAIGQSLSYYVMDDYAKYKLEYFDRKTNMRQTAYWHIIEQFQLHFEGKDYKVVDQWDTFQKEGYGKYRSCDLCHFPICRFVYKIAPIGVTLISQNPELATADSGALVIGDECVLNYTKNADERAKKTVKSNRANVLRAWEKREYFIVAMQYEKWSTGRQFGNIRWTLASKIRSGAISLKELAYLKFLVTSASWSEDNTYPNRVSYTLTDESSLAASKLLEEKQDEVVS